MGSGAAKPVVLANEQLERLTGDEELPHLRAGGAADQSNAESSASSSEISSLADDSSWQQLFLAFEQPLRQHVQPEQADTTTRALCQRIVLHNPRTKNYHKLVTYVAALLARQRQLEAGRDVNASAKEPPLADRRTTLLNGIYLVRVFTKHFIETLSAEELATQLSPDGNSARTLTHALLDYCSIPAQTADSEVYRDVLELLLILFSTQMYRPSSGNASCHPFLDACMRYPHIGRVTHALLHNFVHQRMPPALPSSNFLLSTLSTASSGLLSPLSSWYSYLFTNTGVNGDTNGTNSDQASARTISQLSLMVLLSLAIFTSPDFPTLKSNPFRKQLSTFSDLYYDEEAEPKVARPDLKPSDDRFCLSYSDLFESFPTNFNDDVIMLLYMLIHTNSQFLSYVLARSDIDTLILPLIEILYTVEQQHLEQRAYMILVCLVIITQDKLFNQNIHHLMLGEVAWCKERFLRDLSLGSLLVIVLIRVVQNSLSKLRDSYLPVHCLAALGNMSRYLEGLHPYAAHRLVKLFEMYSRRHASLLRRMSKEEEPLTNSTEASPLITMATDEALLADVESCMEVVLEILNSCLTNALRANPQLTYALLHEKALFAPFTQHQRLSPLLHNIQAVLDHFQFLLSQVNQTELTPDTILEIIQRGSLTWQSREYPVQYTYEEEENAESFFAPLLWNIIRQRTPDFKWNVELAAESESSPSPRSVPSLHLYHGYQRVKLIVGSSQGPKADGAPATIPSLSSS